MTWRFAPGQAPIEDAPIHQPRIRAALTDGEPGAAWSAMRAVVDTAHPMRRDLVHDVKVATSLIVTNPRIDHPSRLRLGQVKVSDRTLGRVSDWVRTSASRYDPDPAPTTAPTTAPATGSVAGSSPQPGGSRTIVKLTKDQARRLKVSTPSATQPAKRTGPPTKPARESVREPSPAMRPAPAPIETPAQPPVQRPVRTRRPRRGRHRQCWLVPGLVKIGTALRPRPRSNPARQARKQHTNPR